MTNLDFLLTQKCTFYGGQSKEYSSQVSYVKLSASSVAILDFKSTQKMWSTNKTQIWTISNISAIYILHHIHDFLEEI